MWLLIAIIGGTLFVSAFCALIEATLASLRPDDIAKIAERRPRIGALWYDLKTDAARSVAAVRVLHVAALVVGSVVAGFQFGRLDGDTGFGTFVVVFAFIVLLCAEVLPRCVAAGHARAAATAFAWPTAWLVRAMGPFETALRLIGRPFIGSPAPAHLPSTADEIASLSRRALLSGEISAEQDRIVRRGMRLSTSTVRDVMRPRVDIDALDVDMPPEEVAGAMAVAGFARIPVYEGDLDHIFGFIYIKDLLLELHMHRPIDVRRLARPAVLVPETLGLDDLLTIFRRERTQMAVVLDEHGGTEGLVTLEDVLEEIAGDIHDEHRPQEAEIVRRGESSWLVSGLVSVDDLLELTGRFELESAVPPNVSTVAGLIQTLLDRIATAGDRTTWHDLSFEVIDLDGLRIGHVLVTIEGSHPG